MSSSAASAGERVERAVLALLLASDESEEASIEELAHEIGDRTGTLRALDKLEVVGLVARIEDKVKPTPAARRFDELNI
jgi:predicted transcriptional regulator